MTYYPCSYILVKVFPKDREPHYRVFGCWGDYWRLNSGIEEIAREGNMLIFHGTSGSMYKVEQDHYHVSPHALSWLKMLEENSKSVVDKLEILEFKDAQEYIESMVLESDDDPTD